MAGPVTEAEVGIDIVGGGLDKALAHIEERVKVITGLVAKAGEAAAKSGNAVNKEFDQSMKAMQATLGQLRTVQNVISQASRVNVTKSVDNQNFAKRTEQAANYAKSVKYAQSAEEAFLARRNDLEKKYADIGARNGLPSRRQESDMARAKQNLEQLKRLDAEVTRLDTRARRTEGNFTPERKRVTSARASLETASLSPSRSNFKPEFDALNQAMDAYQAKLAGVRAEKAAALREDNQAHRNRMAAFKDEQETYRAIIAEEKALLASKSKDEAQAHRNRLASLRDEQETYKAIIAEEKAGENAARRAENERHNLRIANLKLEGLEAAKAIRTLSEVESARGKNGAAIGTLRGEIAGGVTPERERQILAELVALQQVGNSLKQREVNLKAEGARHDNLDVQALRARNQAEVQGLSTLEQVARARTAADTRIAELNAIILTGTRAQVLEAKQLLTTEEKRVALLRQQEKALTPDPGAKSPSLFGNAGVGGVLARTAGYAAAGAAIYGTVGALHEGANASVEFEEKLDQLGAISGATETQVKGLGLTIVEVAKHSKFSSAELADASTELAQAGFSVQGVQTSLKAANDLAIASGSSVSQSVDIMTASMGAFQLQEQDATMVANGLTAALNQSRLALPQVALGIQYAGTTAHEMNISFQDLTAAMAAMAQAGVRSGSQMGTGIRQFLTDLQSPTQKLSDTLRKLGLSFADIDVQTIGLPQVLKNLSAAGFSSAEAYGSMEKRGAAAYLAMRAQLPVFDQVKMAMSDQTAAATASAKAADNLSTAWQRAKTRAFAGWDSAIRPAMDGLKALLNLGDKSALVAELYDKNQAMLQDPKRTGAQYQEFQRQLEELMATEQDLTDVNYKFGDAMEVAATKAGRSSETFAAGKQSLATFDEAMKSVIMRSGSLKDGTQALEAETVQLMNRFPSLAANIDTATNSYGGLIEAMKTARGEMNLTLAAQAYTAGMDAASKAQVAKEARNSVLVDVVRNPQFGNLTAQEQTAIRNFQRDASNPLKVAGLSGAAASKEGDSPMMRALRVLITEMRDQANAKITADQQSNDLLTANSTAVSMNTPALKTLADKVDALSKPGATEAQKSAVIAEARAGQTANQARVNRFTGVERQRQQGFANAYGSLVTQAEATLNNSGAIRDEKPARGAAAAARADASVGDMTALLKRVFGEGTVVLDNSKHRRTTADGNVSDHWGPNARALDFIPEGGMGKYSTDETEQMLEAAGVKIRRNRGGTKQFFGKDRGPHGASDKSHVGHDHVAWEGQVSAEGYDAERARVDVSNEKIALANAKRDLTAKMKDLSNTTSESMFKTGVDSAQSAFDVWSKQLTDFTNADISKQHLLPNESAERLTSMAEEIAQMREELSGKIADGIVKNLEAVFKAIDEATARALAPQDRSLGRAQGLLEGLSRGDYSKNTPEYVRTLAEKRVRDATEQRAQAELPATGIALAGKRDALAVGQARLQDLRASGVVSGTDFDNATASVTSLSAEIDTLAVSYANMRAQADAPSQIVTGLVANVRMALTAWQELNVTSQNFAQSLASNVSPVLESLQNSFGSFFTDATSGTMSLGNAFANMGRSIIQSIQQIVAKLIATKLIEMLVGLALSFVGGSPGAALNSQIGASNSAQIAALPFSLGSFNGGPVRIHGRAGGGSVDTGFPGRDSSLYNLARDEYVVRSSAVKSVGRPFMKNLNEHGARALAGVAQMPPMPAPAKQDVAVYVVAPEEKPSLRPSDVTVIMNQQLLKDGATRKLVKHISQGG